MAAAPLHVSIRQQPRVAIIELHGEINGFAEDAIDGAYAQAERVAPDMILLNFTDVDYINSTGIALIIGLLTRARASQLTLAACSLSPHYQEIFAITRLCDFVEIFADESAALGARSSPA